MRFITFVPVLPGLLHCLVVLVIDGDLVGGKHFVEMGADFFFGGDLVLHPGV